MVLNYDRFGLHPDILLDFLEEDRSLEIAELGIKSTGFSLWSFRRRTDFNACFHDPMSSRLPISSLLFQKGAHLEIVTSTARLGDALDQISTAHLLNLPSLTFTESQPHLGVICLSGLNGRFAFRSFLGSVNTF